MTEPLVEEAARRAVTVLDACVSPLGFSASGRDGGYGEVWARDSMIVLLGVCGAGIDRFEPALRASLETLTSEQGALGAIPTNVNPAGRRSTANAPAADSNLWYVLGHHVLASTFGADELLERHRDALAKAMLWARYQDSDDDGLLESAEAGSWADLMAYRGKVLYTNVLYVLALRAYAALADLVDLPDGPLHAQLAARAAERLNALHWVEAPSGLWQLSQSSALHEDHEEAQRLAQLTTAQLWARPYYLAWVDFRDYGDWCDVLGNVLAVLAGVADDRRAGLILDHLDRVGVAHPYPVRSLEPPINPGEKDWREYYRNAGLNLPHRYHNGGIWPFIGGFHVAVLVAAGRRADAAALLERLARSVRLGAHDEWEFNEWLHGLTGQPMGMPLQAWSAAMYLFAHRAVALGTVPCLSALRA